ncbi:Hypothetical predicted protein [Xyrichtys novacula]|uniref:Uncharacterized protein n=1 Tax=Xyrichtys novacula TaxID=13765 RepID=A0AAV1FDZ8_XYRNO|nr:Hypothetical predicted protein [Xyrichtys novacula]
MASEFFFKERHFGGEEIKQRREKGRAGEWQFEEKRKQESRRAGRERRADFLTSYEHQTFVQLSWSVSFIGDLLSLILFLSSVGPSAAISVTSHPCDLLMNRNQTRVKNQPHAAPEPPPMNPGQTSAARGQRSRSDKSLRPRGWRLFEVRQLTSLNYRKGGGK